jgi:hypothetical protein
MTKSQNMAVWLSRTGSAQQNGFGPSFFCMLWMAKGTQQSLTPALKEERV